MRIYLQHEEASVKVGVVGASGYAGTELLRLCAGHPDLDVVVATAGIHAGEQVAAHTPSLAAAYPSLAYATTDPSTLDGLDLVFLALPHGESQHLVPDLIPRVGTIVDLGADFRLHDPSLYPTWYGTEHSVPSLLEHFVYGLPEIHREELIGARLIAAPGCYPTAAILALAPLTRAGMISTTGIVVDAASGVSGAGRAPRANLHFGAVDEDFVAYGLLDHRHTAEMEQGLGAEILFTPHLAPMVRGILVTCYARPTSSTGETGGATTDEALAIFRDAYDPEAFVTVVAGSPSTKATSGSNCAHVTVRADPRTGWVLAIAALDNLVKGAAGQAVQCANLALGLPEVSGLPLAGIYP
jgi:N-acetyl-gamma-glutamyl-phosphate reductase